MDLFALVTNAGMLAKYNEKSIVQVLPVCHHTIF